ncbi:DNA-processing protein DprA [Arsenicicoccus piscis]|uniref:Smf/DprA SLOG domain-containing protein n=1 Tax=Arsenicicoccus piscis TaxID=673954 RepID=A0ABQ6HNP3_9MICO|nr:DNA-processing protein DprA [Arsenicicoccus piscis]MCH8626978.1 DNA-processing protein DprA [Arsenicicoccus piscis]GMA19099.1 hypothetical protein GCM10025862_11200 [Arsenicicoccus piscis]
MTAGDALDPVAAWAAAMRDERTALAAWSRLAEPGDKRATQLVAELGAREALAAVRGSTDHRDEKFQPRLPHLDVTADLRAAARLGARVIVSGDDEWPPGLDDLVNPPFCLWVRGPLDIAVACARSVAVVGARDSTDYGKRVSADIAYELVERGFAIVSGAAFGIDAAAHRGALAAAGSTIAVLACGVERAYPLAHDTLLAEIARRGAVMSELPPGAVPTRSRFLLRNRMIATMTQGTLVVEAGSRSGSLNTARTAAEYARPVAAVPGPVTSAASSGTHQAVRDGIAVLVTNAEEVAELVGRMGLDAATRPQGPTDPRDLLDDEQHQVLSALPRSRWISTTDVCVRAGLDWRTTSVALSRLETLGLAERNGDGWRVERGARDGLLRPGLDRPAQERLDLAAPSPRRDPSPRQSPTPRPDPASHQDSTSSQAPGPASHESAS